MWEVDLGPNIVLGTWWSPFMVYDLNCDGKAEVITRTSIKDVDYREDDGHVDIGPEWITVFDGETGKEIAKADWIPRGRNMDWGDESGNNANRHMLGIAYFDGIHPSLIVTRGTYKRLAVQTWNFNKDNELEMLWEWNRKDEMGIVGGYHSIRTGDIDGDGKDELINGSIAIDDDGNTMWVTGRGHGDDLCLTDIDPTRPGLEVFYIQEGSNLPVHLRDAATGELIWSVGDRSYGDVGRGLIADLDPTVPGIECWTANASAGLLSCKGVRIADRPSDRGLICGLACWWGPNLTRQLIERNTLYEYDHVTDSSKRIGKAAVKVIADITGDWREELICYEDGQIKVYSPVSVTDHRFVTFMHDPIYRNDISSWSSGYPQNAYTSFYLAADMDKVKPARHIEKLDRDR